MEQHRGIPGRGGGRIAVLPCERQLGGGGRYDDALRVLWGRRFLPCPLGDDGRYDDALWILVRRRFLPRPHPRPRCVRPPPPPPYTVVVVVIVITKGIPSAHLSSSSSPTTEFATPDATSCRGKARRNRTISSIVLREGNYYLQR